MKHSYAVQSWYNERAKRVEQQKSPQQSSGATVLRIDGTDTKITLEPSSQQQQRSIQQDKQQSTSLQCIQVNR